MSVPHPTVIVICEKRFPRLNINRFSKFRIHPSPSAHIRVQERMSVFDPTVIVICEQRFPRLSIDPFSNSLLHPSPSAHIRFLERMAVPQL